MNRLRRSPFVPYTLRHTSITRWAKHIDAYTLHVIAGHTGKRYVHPSDADVLAAMEKARGAANPVSQTIQASAQMRRSEVANWIHGHCLIDGYSGQRIRRYWCS